MAEVAAGGLGAAYLLFWLFVFVVAVLYLFLPFALFGIKPRLDKVIEQQSEILDLMRKQGAAEEPTPPPAKHPSEDYWASHPDKEPPSAQRLDWNR